MWAEGKAKRVEAVGPVIHDYAEGTAKRAILIELRDESGAITDHVVGTEIIPRNGKPKLVGLRAFRPVNQTVAWRNFCDIILHHADEEDQSCEPTDVELDWDFGGPRLVDTGWEESEKAG